MHLFLHRETDYSTDLIWNAQQVCERAYVCVLWILSSWWMYPCLSKCICMSLYGFSTYCSPAFWPQSRSKGSVGWAGPLEEEAEEPQTLEQQHPERQQTERQRDTKSGGGVDRKEREKRSVKKRCKRNRGGNKENKKLVSERNSAGSFAEQFMYTFPISVLLCCVFSSWAEEVFISSRSENRPHQHLF